MLSHKFAPKTIEGRERWFTGSRMWGKRAPGPHGGWIYLDSSNMNYKLKKKIMKEEREERFGPWEDVVAYQPPTIDSSEEEVEQSTYTYPDDPPGSFIISGPMGNYPGPGRRFNSHAEAEQWVVEFYGGFIKRIRQAEDGSRWAYRVRPKRSKV